MVRSHGVQLYTVIKQGVQYKIYLYITDEEKTWSYVEGASQPRTSE